MISKYADGTYLSEEFKQVIAGDGRTFKVQILLEGQPLDGDIAEAKIYRGACGEQPFPGALFVPHMSCEIRETSASLEGKEIEVRIGVLMDREQDVWQWIKQGRYIVSKPEISADIVNFEAIGTLGTEGSEEISLAADYYANLIQKIEAKTGITINVVGLTIPGTKSRAFEGTVRDAAAMVAQGLGGFLTEDVDGNWVIAAYGGGELVDISADRMQQPPQYGENTYELGGVEVESAVVDMTMGNPLLDPWDYVVVEGADLSHFIIDAQGHLILLNSQTVTGEMRMDILQNGRLQYTHDDTADIDFAVDNGHLYMMRTISNAVPCLHITHTFNGGCSTEINAEAETWVQEKSKIMGPAQKNMQHFWTDADGAHVTQKTKEDFLSNPSGGNTLNDSTGFDVRDGLISLAKFGANGARVGKKDEAHTNIGASGMQIYKDATTQLANIGYGEGNAQTGTANAPFYSLGVRRGSNAADIGNYSMSEGYGTKASGAYSHAEGEGSAATGYGSHAECSSAAIGSHSHAEGGGSEASGANSHAEGYNTKANGNWSHAEGYESTASSDYSHAEGSGTTVSGSYSHAEGFRTTASGRTAHAEGSGTTASGSGSHAEGIGTTASGWISHASGQNTIAGYQKQTAIGKFNDNKQNNAFEIGNGVADDARSNAFEADWDGNITAAGNLTVGGHSSQIGDIRIRGMESDTVVHTATGTALCALTLPAGTWSLVGFVRFPSNNTGVRRANITTTRAANDIFVQTSPTQGGVTQLQVCNVVTVAETTTYYLNVYHTAGVDLTLPAGTSDGYINGIRAVRIA